MSQALGDSDFPSVLRQLLPLMKPRGVEDDATGSRSGEDECGPDELILLLVYLYSLADEAQPADQEGDGEELDKLERELVGALTLVITREPELSPLLQKLTGKRPRTLTRHCCCLFACFSMFFATQTYFRLKKKSLHTSCVILFIFLNTSGFCEKVSVSADGSSAFSWYQIGQYASGIAHHQLKCC